MAAKEHYERHLALSNLQSTPEENVKNLSSVFEDCISGKSTLPDLGCSKFHTHGYCYINFDLIAVDFSKNFK